MTRDRKTERKLASLSILGAGAVVVCAPNAAASNIFSFSGVDSNLPAKVGFDTGFGSKFTSKPMGTGTVPAVFKIQALIDNGRTFAATFPEDHAVVINRGSTGAPNLIFAGAAVRDTDAHPRIAALQ